MTVDSIHKLPVGTQWVLQDNPTIRFRAKVTGFRGRQLPQAMVAALALTERGVSLGQGKVYFHQPHPKDGLPASDYFDALLHIKAVPQLFYVPKIWTSQEKDHWTSLTPVQQLHQLDSRHGWVDDFAPILPIVVEYHEGHVGGPIFDGYTTAPVTVHISSRCLVAPTADLRSLCQRMWQATTGKVKERAEQPKHTFFSAKAGNTWDNFDKWHVGKLANAMTELESICRRTSKHCAPSNSWFLLFGHLRKETIDAYHQAHLLGQDYGSTGSQSDWKTTPAE